MRIVIDLQRRPQQLVYNDSMNAALVAALVAAGLTSAEIIGDKSLPWTFAMAGRFVPGKGRKVFVLTVSSPSERFAEALEKLDPAAIRVVSSNGDRIDCAGGVKRSGRLLAPGVSETMVCAGSPILIMKRKASRTKTEWFDDLAGVDLDAAIRNGLAQRAGRELDLSVKADRLTLAAGVDRHLVHLRKAPGGRKVILPAFSLPLALRGAAEDLRFAYLAGLGAKTRFGFGCPILPN